MMRSLILWSCIGASLMAQTQILTKEDVVSIALTSNPSIQIATQDSSIAKSKIGQSRSAYLPQAAATAGAQHTDIDTIGDDNYVTAGVQASQLIFDFGKTTGAIEGTESRYNASKADVLTSKNDIIFDAAKEYYAVLKRYHLIGVQKEYVDINDKQLYQAQEYFKAGVRAKIDVTNAQLELSNAKLDLLRAKSKLDVERVNLEQVMGIRPNDGQYQLDEESVELNTLYARVKPLPQTVDILVNEAMLYRPELRSSLEQIQGANADVKSVRGEYYPTIDASGKYQYSNADFSSMDSTGNLNDIWSAGVYANWEFFSGFKTDAKSEEARSNVLRYEAQKQKIRLQIIHEVTNAYNLAKLYREAIELQVVAVRLSSENLQLAEERYKSGLGDMIELNDAQVKYTQAKTDFVVSYYDYNTALANIDHAIAKAVQ